MKVAFATQDGIRVNAHFGWAKTIAIYEVDENEARHWKTIEFSGDLEEDGNEDKLEAKLVAIRDCAILYVAAIGASGAARVVAQKIHPVKAKDLEPIREILEKLQEVLRGTPPPWLRKALAKGKARTFDFEEERE